MMHFISNDSKANVVGPIGSQPIALAAAALVILVVGVGSIVLWRAYTGTSPEQDRIASARQLQARTAQASEQLIEKTKGIETSQQESIDQLQVVQDQLQTVRRLLTAQQADTKKLSEQVGALLAPSTACGNPSPAPIVRGIQSALCSKYLGQPRRTRQEVDWLARVASP